MESKLRFKHKALKRCHEKGTAAGLPAQQIQKIKRMLRLLASIERVEELDYPYLKLHALQARGPRVYSVWVTGNWRITFRFTDKEIVDINLEDYH